MDILEDLVELFRSGNADQQYWCVQLMVEMGPYSLNALEMVLNCDDPTLQQIALTSLAKHKSKLADGIFDSSSQKTYQSLLDQEWSRKLSTNASFGIAEAIKLQFKNHLSSLEKKSDV